MDVDGDGAPELAVAVGHPCAGTDGPVGALLLFQNDGRGGFSVPQSYPVGQQPAAIAAGDLDGDGDLDLAVANAGSDDVTVLLNGGGGFHEQWHFATGSGVCAVRLADIDGDGDLDLVTADERSHTVSVVTNITATAARDGNANGVLDSRRGAIPYLAAKV